MADQMQDEGPANPPGLSVSGPGLSAPTAAAGPLDAGQQNDGPGAPPAKKSPPPVPLAALRMLPTPAESTGAPKGQVGTGVSVGVQHTDPHANDPWYMRALGHLARPVGKAVEEASRATVNIGAEVVHGAATHVPGGDTWLKKEGLLGGADFARWYASTKDDTAERNPLRFGKWAEDVYGTQPKGLAGVGEDLTQLATGFFLASKAFELPSYIAGSSLAEGATAASRFFFTGERAASATARAVSVATTARTAAVVDASFMDPYKYNLLGVVDRSPESVQGAFHRALAADTDQPETWNRLKMSLQGFLVGKALESVVGITRSVWLWNKASALPLGSAERDALEGRIRDAIAPQARSVAADAAPAGTPVVAGVVQHADGTFEVRGYRGVAAGQDPLAPGVGGARFITPDAGEAQGYATNGGRTSGDLHAVVGKMKNPLILGGFHEDPIWKQMDMEEVIQHAKDNGHDGIIIRHGSGGHPEVALFDNASAEVVPPGQVHHVGDAAEQQAATAAERPAFAFGRELGSPKPRYGAGAYGNYELTFASDLDRAAFILHSAAGKMSAAHGRILKAVMEQTGLTEEEILAHGAKVKQTVKDLAGQDRGANAALDVPEVAGDFSRLAAPRTQFDAAQGEDGMFRLVQNGKSVTDGPAFRTAGEANAAAAGLNDFMPVPPGALQDLTKQIHDRIVSGADPNDLKGLLDGTAFNFRWVSSTNDAKAWINAVAEAYSTAHAAARQSMEETGKIAQDIFGGTTPQEAISLASEVLGHVEDLPGKIWGLRAYQHATAGYLSDLSLKIDAAGKSADVLDVEKLRMALGTLFELGPKLKRIGTRVGQSLNIFKGEVPHDGIQYATPENAVREVPLGSDGAQTAGAAPGTGPRAPASAGVFAGMTKKQILDVARNIRLAGGDPDVIRKYLGDALPIKPPKPDSPAWSLFQGVRYNALLSGPLTHAKNIFSNLFMFLGKQAELTSFGSRTGNKDLFMQGVDQLSSLWLDSRESLHAALTAARQGSPVLEKEAQKEGIQEAVQMLMSGGGNSLPMAYLNRIWNAPGTFLMAEDEFFKQLSYRANVRSAALREARQMGLPSEQMVDHVQGALDGAFRPDGGGVNTQALDAAREATFTRELVGSANTVSDALGSNKVLSFFFPFRRTPINVFLAAAERTPGLWRISTTMRAELSGTYGAHRLVEAQAKRDFGQNLWLLATGLAASGHLSGGGPKDPKARAQLLATGWLPYSAKVPGTNQWVSFQATEPFSTIFGIAADATSAVDDLSREARKQDFTDLAGAFMLGTGANIYNKTFLKGLSDLSDILSGNVTAGERVAASLGQQMVPFGGLLTQTNTDDVMRDAKTVKERVLSRLPYFSKEVEPVRTVLGEPLLKQSWVERSLWPFTVSEQSGTKEQALMKDLLAGLGEGAQIPMPGQTQYNGLLNLRDRDAFDPNGKRQSPYDRMLELFATGTQDLPPIKEALRAVVDQNHKQLRDIFGPTGFKYGYWKSALPTEGVGASDADTRLGIVRGVLDEYKKSAWNQVLREYPKLQQKVDTLDGERTGRKLDKAYNTLDSFRAFSQTATP